MSAPTLPDTIKRNFYFFLLHIFFFPFLNEFKFGKDVYMYVHVYAEI